MVLIGKLSVSPKVNPGVEGESLLLIINSLLLKGTPLHLTYNHEHVLFPNLNFTVNRCTHPSLPVLPSITLALVNTVAKSNDSVATNQVATTPCASGSSISGSFPTAYYMPEAAFPGITSFTTSPKQHSRVPLALRHPLSIPRFAAGTRSDPHFSFLLLYYPISRRTWVLFPIYFFCLVVDPISVDYFSFWFWQVPPNALAFLPFQSWLCTKIVHSIKSLHLI